METDLTESSLVGKIPDDEKFRKFLSGYRYKPFYYLSAPDELIDDYFFRTLESKTGTRFLLGRTGGEYTYCVVIRHLDFDTDIFECKMARIEHLHSVSEHFNEAVDSVLGFLARNKYEFVDITIDSNDFKLMSALNDGGFRYVGGAVTSGLDIPKLINIREDLKKAVIRPYQESDYENVVRIATDSFTRHTENLNRFIIDGRFNEANVGVLYRRWIENCISGKLAQKVLVADIDGNAVGFIACSVIEIQKNRLIIGDIPLNAVDRSYRKKGIYRALVESALEWFGDCGIGYVVIKTQMTTLAPQYVWQKFGGKLVKSEYNFHKWLRTS